MSADALEDPFRLEPPPLDEIEMSLISRASEVERAGILALPTDDPLDSKRRARVEATRDELFDQSRAIEGTWSNNAQALASISSRINRFQPTRIFLVGAGDSLVATIAARWAFELMLGVPCEAVPSLEFAYYRQHFVTKKAIVIALSSSGGTVRTIESVLLARRAGALTLALTNVAGSAMAGTADELLTIEATRVGWPTQSTTAALALLLRLAVLIGRRRGARGAQELERDLTVVPALIYQALRENDESVEHISRVEAHREMYLFSGGGPNWAAAIAGAAKVKETTPNHALEIEVEEYHHYNSQKSGEPLFVFAPTGRSVPRALDTGRDARRYGGQFYAITTANEHAFDHDANEVLKVPRVSEPLSPMLFIPIAHLVGYHVGMAKFAAADRGLGVD